MSNTDSDLCEKTSPQEDPQGSSQTRVDRAHVVPNADSESSAEQLRGQADQLAAYLRSRQRDLDQRESQLNARLALFDGLARNARLEAIQQQTELAQRESTLEEREREVEARLARLTSTESVAERLRQQLDEDRARQEKFKKEIQSERAALAAIRLEQAGKENALCYQRQQIDRHREASLQLVRQLMAGLERRRLAIEARAGEPSADLLQREQKTRQLAATWENRCGQLELSEAHLAETRAETERLRRRLILERQEVHQEAEAQSRRLIAGHRRVVAELERKRDALRRRSEQVDRSRAALLKLRSEMGRMHRETLEIRMATEELWVQMPGTTPPIALSRSLAQVRAQLADQNRMAATELTEQKQELRTIQDELSRQQQQLLKRKRELESWAKRREEEIQRQTTRFTAWERELWRRQTNLDESVRQWQSEQLDYQTEIRQLRTRLNEPSLAT